jgi:single-strand DNA-binding protein
MTDQSSPALSPDSWKEVSRQEILLEWQPEPGVIYTGAYQKAIFEGCTGVWIAKGPGMRPTLCQSRHCVLDACVEHYQTRQKLKTVKREERPGSPPDINPDLDDTPYRVWSNNRLIATTAYAADAINLVQRNTRFTVTNGGVVLYPACGIGPKHAQNRALMYNLFLSRAYPNGGSFKERMENAGWPVPHEHTDENCRGPTGNRVALFSGKGCPFCRGRQRISVQKQRVRWRRHRARRMERRRRDRLSQPKVLPTTLEINMSINRQIILGHVGQTPDLRNTANGTAVCNFSVATNHKFKDEDETTWHRCVAFGRAAEVLAQYVSKGERLYVDGRTVQREWTDKDGVKRVSHEVLVDNFELLGSPQGRRASNSSNPRGGAAPDPSAPLNRSEDFDDDIPF